MNKVIGIYKITNLVNNKIYIGQSWNIYKRWYVETRGGCNSHLKRSFAKYGLDNFKFEIIMQLKENFFTQKYLNIFEIHYISLFKTYDPKLGYNKTFGGSAGKLTAETRQKIGNARRGKKRAAFSYAQRQQMSKSHKGKKHSNETKIKIGVSNKGRVISEITRKKISIGNLGKKLTDITRERMSNSHKLNKTNVGRKLSEATKIKISNTRKLRIQLGLILPTRSMLGKKHSELTKKKISESSKGRYVSAETRAKISKIHKGKHVTKITKIKMSIASKNKEKVQCPHCYKIGDISNMKQWHFNNCLLNSYNNPLQAKCPHCGVTGRGGNMTRFHFKNCILNPDRDKTKVLTNFGEITRKKISDSLKKHPKVKCPWCDKIGSASNMARWHFNHCKLKPIEEENTAVNVIEL